MIDVYIATGQGTEDEDSIDGFALPAVPRVGEIIYISYARRLHPNNEKRWTAESIEHAKQFDGTRWKVESVYWEASIDGDGRCTVYVTKDEDA